jgi:hypothetical protein
MFDAKIYFQSMTGHWSLAFLNFQVERDAVPILRVILPTIADISPLAQKVSRSRLNVDHISNQISMSFGCKRALDELPMRHI